MQYEASLRAREFVAKLVGKGRKGVVFAPTVLHNLYDRGGDKGLNGRGDFARHDLGTFAFLSGWGFG